MDKINLNCGWRIIDRPPLPSDNEIPVDNEIISLPFDIYTSSARDFSNSVGEFNGYYNGGTVIIEKELPRLDKCHKAILDISGVASVAEVFLNGEKVRTVCYPSHALIEITDKLLSGTNTLKLVICAYSDSGKYTGLGISGGIELIVIKSATYIEPYGVFVVSQSAEGKAALCVKVDAVNDTTNTKQFNIKAEILNEKGKRIVKKIRKVKLAANSKKTFDLNIKLSRAYEWNGYDPYVYGVKVSLSELSNNEKAIDESTLNFGISHARLDGRSLLHNNNRLKLKGTVVAHDNGILGNVSELSAELYKLGKIKSMGFNAVRYIGCPSDAVLDALDKLGLLCVVDLFDVWNSSRFVNDGHLFFERSYEEVVKNSILALRNHPCVVMYNIGDNTEESYNRCGGIETAKKIVELVRRYDSSRLVSANAFERIPTDAEIEKHDIKIAKADRSRAQGLGKKLVFAAREKDLFNRVTEGIFALVDVAGYSYLYGRYSSDRILHSSRTILGLASHRSKAFDALEEAEKNPNVIGDFVFAGADFIGAYDMHGEESQLVRPHTNTNGLLDITYRKKELSYYSEIVLGKKSSAYILVQDPDTAGENDEFDMNSASHLWNWPRHIGKSVKIRVVTTGDIVALTLDGKAIGRKLAGKFNKNIADFKTNFYPGKLEAVSYTKGVETSRVTLESVTSPKLLKIECACKSLKENDLCYVNIHVCDKEGRLVPYAMRQISVDITGEGVLEAIGNGDPEHLSIKGQSSCPTYNGIITAVVRATKEGKIFVKATSEGLLSNKATIKVK